MRSPSAHADDLVRGLRPRAPECLALVVGELEGQRPSNTTVSTSRKASARARGYGRARDHFNPGAFVPMRAKRMLEADFSHPSWELAMARKDARLMIDESKHAKVQLDLIPAIASWMDRYIAAGHAHDDWTVIATDALK